MNQTPVAFNAAKVLVRAEISAWPGPNATRHQHHENVALLGPLLRGHDTVEVATASTDPLDEAVLHVHEK